VFLEKEKSTLIYGKLDKISEKYGLYFDIELSYQLFIQHSRNLCLLNWSLLVKGCTVLHQLMLTSNTNHGFYFENNKNIDCIEIDVQFNVSFN
jgi:hypothetical protein